MLPKSVAKFEEKLACGLENDMRQIFIGTFESVKIGIFMGYFCPKQKIHELQIYRGVVVI